jgi:hypothetical protein
MPATDERRAWLRDAMRRIWYELERTGGVPLVLTVVALENGQVIDDDTTTGLAGLVSLTCSVRAPGRIYAQPVEQEDGRRKGGTDRT